MRLDLAPEDMALFREEGAHYLKTLEEGHLLLRARGEAPLDPNVVHAMFRAAHSLKGAAGMLGLTTLLAASHELESVLGRLRAGTLASDLPLLAALGPVVDVLGTLFGADDAARSDVTGAIARLSDLIRAQEEGREPRALREPLPAWVDAAALDAAARALGAGRYLYVAFLTMDGCRYVDGKLDHPVFEKLLGAAHLIALHADSPLPSDRSCDSFAFQGQALVHSAAEPAVLNSLMPLGPQLRLVHAPTVRSDEARMVPIERVFAACSRLVGDLAPALGKQVKLETRGHGTLIDQALAEALVDPLRHLVRNALDHGIEPGALREQVGKSRVGTLWLSVQLVDQTLVLTLEDDGRGLDLGKILEKARELGLASGHLPYTDPEIRSFIFAPGVTTSERLTLVSGRGVGLDAVSEALSKLKGRIRVRSVLGSGATFVLTLPVNPPPEAGLT